MAASMRLLSTPSGLTADEWVDTPGLQPSPNDFIILHDFGERVSLPKTPNYQIAKLKKPNQPEEIKSERSYRH